MKDNPLISIITPVYNGEKYILETVLSVLNSKISYSFEYLVVNDGSTDETEKILSDFEGRLRYFSQNNSGEASAVNRGIKEARGQFVLVLNADDPLLSPQIFDELIPEFYSDPTIVAVYPDWLIIDQTGEKVKTILLDEFSESYLIGRNRCLPGPGTVFKRESALQINGRNPKWIFVGDFDFWLRLSRIGRIKHHSGVLAAWRQNPNSTSISRRGAAMAMERISVIEEFTKDFALTEKIKRQAISNSLYLAARLQYFDRSIKGRNLIFKSFMIRRGWVEEARIHVIFYLLLYPVSSIVVSTAKRIASLVALK
jgi:glycosyltransferase involved in cell wall biosynthesis